MKLKLKVSKNLKRDLRKEAEKKDMERMDYVLNIIREHLDETKDIWEAYVEAYPSLLEKRQIALAELKEKLVDEADDIKRQTLKAFYQENHMYIDFVNRQRKFENLIIPLEDDVYYGLCLLGENKKMTVERFTVELLSIKSKNS
ncbi:hypothetical protein EZV73_25310 [Acidaminobacter sp. JC074]|uniref:hypothetical protein n=1 Tax=Acidaminobacter sp. JC074 TaxID=2530199 RepID=UPI001F0EFDA4|nr:hypothetical protein [Acidaminobacter sp. JC074]MCH4890924.1 hypothetical protein [Acidaminobacter sp. JC074]